MDWCWPLGGYVVWEVIDSKDCEVQQLAVEVAQVVSR